MPILKKDEPLPERSVVIGIYGEAGSCKTTLGNTANEVLVLDFDRGVSRSLYRQDTVIINSWNDVLHEQKEGTFKNYKTVVVDTAKAALDDFLMSYVVEVDYKLKTNKLGAYGAIGDQFKLFLNHLRNEGIDLVIIAHAKKDEDTKKIIPDVTGQSYQLLLRVADQVGYVNFVNNERTIQWSPTDLTVGKNTAGLPMIRIPDKSQPELKTFMAGVIEATKKAIVDLSEAQREATAKAEEYQNRLGSIDSPDALTDLLQEVNALPDHFKTPLRKMISDKSKELGYVVNTESKRYEKPTDKTSDEQKSGDTQQDKSTDNNNKDLDEALATSLDSRCQVLAALGLQLEVDRAVAKDIVVDYVKLSEMTDEQFNDLVVDVSTKLKSKTRKAKAA